MYIVYKKELDQMRPSIGIDIGGLSSLVGQEIQFINIQINTYK